MSKYSARIENGIIPSTKDESSTLGNTIIPSNSLGWDADTYAYLKAMSTFEYAGRYNEFTSQMSDVHWAKYYELPRARRMYLFRLWCQRADANKKEK